MKRMITGKFIRRLTGIYEWWNKFRSNELLRRLVTVLSLDILVKASAVVLLPVYLHLMTQQQYGSFNYILSIAYSFSALLNLGLYVPQSKLYHDDHDPVRRGKMLFSINVLLAAGLVLLVLPVYFFGMDYSVVRMLFRNSIPYEHYRLWILLLTLTSLFAYMLSNFFYTAERIDLIKRYSLLRVLGINGAAILALYFLRRTDPVKLRFIAIAGVESMLLATFCGRYFAEMVRKTDRRLLIKCLRLAVPVMLSSVFGIIINFGDKFFLEKNVDLSVLSVYYLGTSCAGVISLLSNSLQNVWLPLFFKEKDLAANFRRTNRLMGRLAWILSALCITVMIAVMISLHLNLIPKAYSEIVRLLPLQLGGQVAICIALLYGNYLIYFERTSLILWTGLGISVISTLLNMMLVPIWKMYGAAMTLLISNLSYLLIYYLIVRFYKKNRLVIHESIFRQHQ